jgi:hypothetical protein
MNQSKDSNNQGKEDSFDTSGEIQSKFYHVIVVVLLRLLLFLFTFWLDSICPLLNPTPSNSFYYLFIFLQC